MKRFYELLPGSLAWLTIILMFLLSRFIPTFVAIFIILFDIYWLLKSIYLSFHLRATYGAMKENMSIDWLRRLEEGDKTKGWRDYYHLILFPMYTEPYEVVRDSFETLLKSNFPKDKFIVVLAIEERAGAEAAETAKRIEAEYGNKFHRFLVTTHPKDLEGEIPGKGSNETWAGRQVKAEIIDKEKIAYDRIMVSVFDIDTQLYMEYFGRLMYVYLNSENRNRAIYQPIPLFFNNIYEAPALARVVASSSTFWQMMQQARPDRLTSFSSQSLPFQALVDMDFWNTDIVSEDSRVFWQGYMTYHSDFRVEPLLYPVSMDVNVASTFWQTLKNTYKQQRRWGWGAENIPYMLAGFRRDKEIPFKKKAYWTFSVLEGFHSWATNALMIFALGWLPLWLGGPIFNTSLLSYSLPRLTRILIQLSMIGVASSALLSVLLLPPKPKWFRKWHYSLYVLQWVLMPFTLIIFGAFPGLEAQTRLMIGGKYRLGFWVTPKSRRNTESGKGVGGTGVPAA